MIKALNLKTLLLIITIPPAIVVLGCSIYTFPIQDVDINLLFLGLTMLILCSFTQIQIPRTKIYVTLSDLFIFITFLTYGGEVATVLAMSECFLT